MNIFQGIIVVMFSILSSFVLADSHHGESHGISYPQGWQSWSAIAVSHRTDNDTLRAILGNDIAVKAARSGKVNP